jgi:Flp pilus assembly protein TadG
MRRAIWSRAERRVRGDEGAVLVEAALAIPFLVALLLGVIEYGYQFRQANVVDRSVTAAGRVVAQQGRGRYADYEAIRTLASILSALPSDKEVNKVMIYNPDANGNPTGACLSTSATGSKAGVAGQCNVYSESQINTANPTGFFGTSGSTCSGSAWDGNFCPLDRCNDVSGGCAPFGSVGVYVEVTTKTLSKFYGIEQTIQRQAYYLLEPGSVGSS